MLNIDYKVLDKMLEDLINTDCIKIETKECLKKFISTHDPNSMSESACEDMHGIYILTLKPAYEAVTGAFLPNLFIRRS